MALDLIGPAEPASASSRAATYPRILSHSQPRNGEPVSQRASRGLRGPVCGLMLDACDVLYDDTEWRRWLLRVMARLGFRCNAQSFFQTLDRDYLPAVYRGEQEFCPALGAYLLSAGFSQGEADEICNACHSHRREGEFALRPLLGVRPTLARLAATGMTLAVVANTEHDGPSLALRLGRLVDVRLAAVVSSRELGRAMPEAECYQTALDAMKLPAHQVAFVGHDAAELAGAAALGLATIAFNSPHDTEADLHVQFFGELLELPRLELARAG